MCFLIVINFDSTPWSSSDGGGPKTARPGSAVQPHTVHGNVMIHYHALLAGKVEPNVLLHVLWVLLCVLQEKLIINFGLSRNISVSYRSTCRPWTRSLDGVVVWCTFHTVQCVAIFQCSEPVILYPIVCLCTFGLLMLLLINPLTPIHFDIWPLPAVKWPSISFSHYRFGFYSPRSDLFFTWGCC